jgi:tRNA(fMet)-specific endonuclease VapC
MSSSPLPPVRYILDTNAVTYQQLGKPSIVHRLAQFSPDEIGTTVITMYEQLRGRLAAVNRKQSTEELQISFERLQRTQRYYCRVRVLPFDAAAISEYQRLINQGLRIGAQDLQIAAIALAYHAVLVTSNQRHFERVPGLIIEDWSS